jgi:Putative zinc-finger
MATRKRTQALTKTCKQMTNLVFDYLNDKLAPTTKRDFQRHLRICPDCVNFLNTYKKTVAVTRSVAIDDIPQKVRNNILTFLRKRMHRLGTYPLVVIAHLISASGLLGTFLTRCIDFIHPHV